MMELFSIASGSSGNCICIGNDRTHVLVDVGLSGKRLEAGLNEAGYSAKEMAGILITHEHSDHIMGLGVLARRYGLPIYATAGTIAAIQGPCRKIVKDIDAGLFHPIRADVPFSVGELEIEAFSISHDAAEPVGYLAGDGKQKMGVVTDLGMYDDYIIERVSGLSGLLLEANHDERMLEVGPYPYHLKRRIRSSRGHLSNAMSGQLLDRVLNERISRVLLGHLSKENNYERLAYETVRSEVTMGDGPFSGSDFPISVAPRDGLSDRIVA